MNNTIKIMLTILFAYSIRTTFCGGNDQQKNAPKSPIEVEIEVENSEFYNRCEKRCFELYGSELLTSRNIQHCKAQCFTLALMLLEQQQKNNSKS